MRIVIADSAAPSTTPGTISWCRFLSGDSVNGTYSTDGDQPHQIDGNTTTSVPTQNALPAPEPLTLSISCELETAGSSGICDVGTMTRRGSEVSSFA